MRVMGNLYVDGYFACQISPPEIAKQWSALKIAIAVETISTTPSTLVTAQWHYYLSSHSAKNLNLASYIRNHWVIENKLHWVLDVQMRRQIVSTKVLELLQYSGALH